MAQKGVKLLYIVVGLSVMVLMLLSLGSEPVTHARLGMVVDGSLIARMPKDCESVMVHFYSQNCVVCERVRGMLAQLPMAQRRCWLGVATHGSALAQESLFGHQVLDHGELAVDWGVARVPETFVVHQGRVVDLWDKVHQYEALL